MRIIFLLSIVLLSSCAGPGQIARGQKYVSPLGEFTCGPFLLDTQSQASFGTHGGTVRFVDESDMTRVDIEEFQPKLDSNTLLQNRSRLYESYLSEKILPLVKSGVPGAKLLDARSSVINGYTVYQSAILMPEASNAVSGNGKRLDGIRGQVQYTNDRHMYTVSVISVAFQDSTNEKQIDIALSYSGRVFKQCEFPR